MSSAIETRGLEYRLGKSFEIRNLALNVPEGSIYGFLGPNGAGKTTTIQLLLAMRRARAGSIRVLGKRVPQEIKRVLAKTGYVPERPHVDPSLRIEEALRFHGAFYRDWDAAQADSLLTQFELDKTRRIKRLSKGETGKFLMILALAQRPELLLLDEPTDGLDPVVRREVMSAVVDYVSQRSATVFISSHLVHEVERMCNWIGVMDDGRLVAEMTTDSFKSSIKRLRVADAPPAVVDPPFVLLSRQPSDGVSEGELWVVRGWQAPMSEYLESAGARLTEVMDLDLEDGFVELLRTSRVQQPLESN
ncbi:MAG: ABC transporter ATP-binding protein [Gemmatimonadota bacterium]|nr:MAG: ABC transporter ATP-binding protein [Gemmatimonadota bacterium]